jgi:3-deoxy-D-manno-octulosonic-acid transferase
MIRLLYSLFLVLATPWLLLHLLLRSRQQPEYREHWGERFGFYKLARPEGRLIWIHAVSVGETRAAQALVSELRNSFSDCAILLTHMTPTGRATSEQLFGEGVLRCYLPYDYPFAARQFLEHFKPTLGILIETEVWPNLVAECRRAQVHLVLVNARLSVKSFKKAQRVGALIRPALENLSSVLAQSRQDADRLHLLGARHPIVTGNLKFDVAPPQEQLDLGQSFRQLIGTRPVFLAASTREGEEAVLLTALQEALSENSSASFPADALLILVPRHPQRFDAVAQLLQLQGLSFQRRSAARIDPPLPAGSLDPAVRVWLGDSMGEMFAYYAAADIAFIGGSLLPLGGQNLIEACAVGCPVLVGPHTFNFMQVTEDALSAGAAVRVSDAGDLMKQAGRILADPARRGEMSEKALRFTGAHRGAAQRTIALLTRFIGPGKKS